MRTNRLQPTRAGRAIGALFFSVFGGAWLVLGVSKGASGAAATATVAGVVAATLALGWTALRLFRRHRAELAAEAGSPARRRAIRIFNIVNITQWVAIFIVANVLINLGLPQWVLPAAMFIIGLHFLPLAFVFASRAHYVTGAAFMLLALAYPALARGGPADPVGCLGAGAMLWLSAMWALRPGAAPAPAVK